MTGGHNRHNIIAGGTPRLGDITLDGPEAAKWVALEIQKCHGIYKRLSAGMAI